MAHPVRRTLQFVLSVTAILAASLAQAQVDRPLSRPAPGGLMPPSPANPPLSPLDPEVEAAGAGIRRNPARRSRWPLKKNEAARGARRKAA